MEGWLYLISSNRIGLLLTQKVFFVLQDHLLKTFKSVPLSIHEDPIRSAIIDSCIEVADNGKERIQRKVLFVFTVYNTSNQGDQLKLGARSAEEAARWMHSLKAAALKDDQNQVVAKCALSEAWPVRSHFSSRLPHLNAFERTIWSSIAREVMAREGVTPSRWTIFGYKKGLRLFKEAKERGFRGMRNKHPAIMAVGVVDASSEDIFQTLMSLGPSRSEWDFCFDKGSVIEHVDGHNDIVHKQLHSDWLPRGMKPRELLLQRYWRRDDDGIYVILYHSVTHQKCPTEKGFVRAYLKSGGFVVSPVNEGKQSVVKHMLAIDWKSWSCCFRASSSQSITIRMVGRVAALREMFRAKAGEGSISGELTRERMLHHGGEHLKLGGETGLDNGKGKEECEEEEEEEEESKTPSEYGSLVALSEATTEFFDVFEPSNYDLLEDGWTSDFITDMYSQDTRRPKYLSTAAFAKRLHDFAGPKRGNINSHETARKDGVSCNYGFTYPKDPSGNMQCSWTTADPSTLLIRGKTYLEDRKKITPQGTLMEIVAADWLKSDKREDDLAGRPGSVVQQYAARNGPEFFFIVNFQFPGATTHNLAFYLLLSTPVEEASLLDKFIKGDDAYRNARFKLISSVFQGHWIVKHLVGKKPSLVGQAVKVNYFRGKNYLELGIDMGSTTLARHTISIILGYMNNAIPEIAFLIQGNTAEELPEVLLGSCRINHLDLSKAVPVNSI